MSSYFFEFFVIYSDLFSVDLVIVLEFKFEIYKVEESVYLIIKPD